MQSASEIEVVRDLYSYCNQFLVWINNHYEIVPNKRGVANACFEMKCHALDYVHEQLLCIEGQSNSYLKGTSARTLTARLTTSLNQDSTNSSHPQTR